MVTLYFFLMDMMTWLWIKLYFESLTRIFFMTNESTKKPGSLTIPFHCMCSHAAYRMHTMPRLILTTHDSHYFLTSRSACHLTITLWWSDILTCKGIIPYRNAFWLLATPCLKTCRLVLLVVTSWCIVRLLRPRANWLGGCWLCPSIIWIHV